MPPCSRASPQSTVYDWARKGLVVPSISPEREKLWSYVDLMALRIVAWLRRPKGPDDDQRQASAMREVRVRRFTDSTSFSFDIWYGRLGHSPLFVKPDGEIIIVRGAVADNVSVQGVYSQCLDLLGPIGGSDGGRGPDLRRPREHLRIVPGKCAGEPHVDGSRSTTPTIAAVAARGYGLDDLARLYPEESAEEPRRGQRHPRDVSRRGRSRRPLMVKPQPVGSRRPELSHADPQGSGPSSSSTFVSCPCARSTRRLPTLDDRQLVIASISSVIPGSSRTTTRC